MKVFYENLQGAARREVAALWRSRDDEPEPCGSSPFLRSTYESDPERESDIHDGVKLWGIAAEHLDRKLFNVLFWLYNQDLTQKETGVRTGHSRTRVYQLEYKALRKLKHAVELLNQPGYDKPRIKRAMQVRTTFAEGVARDTERDASPAKKTAKLRTIHTELCATETKKPLTQTELNELIAITDFEQWKTAMRMRMRYPRNV